MKERIRITIAKIKPKLHTAKAHLLKLAPKQKSKRLTILLLLLLLSCSLLCCRRRRQCSALEGYEAAVRGDEARLLGALGDAGGDHLCRTHTADMLNLVPYNRSIPDVCHPLCARAAYPPALPRASAVIAFRDPPYPALLRTLWNLLAASGWVEGGYRGRRARGGANGSRAQPPSPHYLEEIILVDAASSREELRGKLAHYVRTRLPPGLVRIIRLPHYVGRTHARAIGARAANGEILLFMEAGSEGARDWLRPLLHRVGTNRRVVAVPTQDQINAATLEYSEIVLFETSIGGFDFSGDFLWLPVPGGRQPAPRSKVDPVPSPTMYGRVFAIDRSWFRALGGFEGALADAAGDALQLSLKIWMCGGSIETIPCSHVGSLEPPVEPAGAGAGGARGARARAAVGWMDEYAELFFMFNPELREQSTAVAEDETSLLDPPDETSLLDPPDVTSYLDAGGDVASSLRLRARLRCRPFSWYMQHVYPDKFLPFVDVVAWGRLATPAPRQLCATGGGLPRVRALPCARRLRGDQLWALDRQQRLRNDEKCLVVFNTFLPLDMRGVVFMVCTVGEPRHNERWELHSGSLRHVASGACLDAGWLAGGPLLPGRCGGGATQLRFDFHGDQPMFSKKELFSSKEQLIALEKIRHARAADLRNDSATDVSIGID
ncbi:hypothetical protein JYU34_000852 [Plutella xylostella]|uniref:Polypeptide N-acetylgalactosaminyltransferase n=1 Tax=Plutella xylostella TaxID=51655 RepID=A0ABQ7R5L1_PLUXY|nr:hypothetical protein JYU34_000852 [Plutella xylostella]